MNDLLRWLPAYLLEGGWELGGQVHIKYAGLPGREFLYEIDDEDAFVFHPEMPEQDRATTMMQLASLHSFQRKGPVVIRPSEDMARALLDTEVRVPVAEYRQPFEVIGVELPPPVAGPHYPSLTIVWRPFPEGVFVWTYSTHNRFTYHIRIGDNLPTIEDRLATGEGCDTEDEYRLMVLGGRVALNACMLASHRSTEISPLLPRVARNRKRADDRLNRLAAREFQEVRFRDLVVKPSPKADVMEGFRGTQTKQRRRGHWKNAAYGPKFSMRKWIWVSEYETKVGQEWPDGKPPLTILE